MRKHRVGQSENVADKTILSINMSPWITIFINILSRFVIVLEGSVINWFMFCVVL